MLNNEDLDILKNVATMLRELDLEKNSLEAIREVLYYIANEIDNITFKIKDNKKKASDTANDYNKRNKKYHSLINSLSYHKKRKNSAKVKEITEKLETLKKMK